MKKHILQTAFAAFLAFSVFTGCSNKDDKQMLGDIAAEANTVPTGGDFVNRERLIVGEWAQTHTAHDDNNNNVADPAELVYNSPTVIKYHFNSDHTGYTETINGDAITPPAPFKWDLINNQQYLQISSVGARFIPAKIITLNQNNLVTETGDSESGKDWAFYTKNYESQ